MHAYTFTCALGLVLGGGALRAGGIVGWRGGVVVSRAGRGRRRDWSCLWFGTVCRQQGPEPTFPFIPCPEWPWQSRKQVVNVSTSIGRDFGKMSPDFLEPMVCAMRQTEATLCRHRRSRKKHNSS